MAEITNLPKANNRSELEEYLALKLDDIVGWREYNARVFETCEGYAEIVKQQLANSSESC